MNNGHLPAGRAVQGGPGHGVDMGQGPGGPPRRGGRSPYPPHYHQPQHQPQHVNHQMYSNYMNPYANPYGYPPMPPHFAQNGSLPNGYMPYQQQYTRSPPAMQQYVPMGGAMPPQQYQRQAQQSPVIVTTPYQPPPHRQSPIVVSTPHQAPPPPPPRAEVQHVPVPAPIPPPTPSSTHSSQAIPTPLSPAASQTQESSKPSAPTEVVEPVTPAPREPFRPPLPWCTHPIESFPRRAPKSRRRRRILADADDVELPIHQGEAMLEAGKDDSQSAANTGDSQRKGTPASISKAGASSSAVTQPSRSETPSTQEHHSEYATSTSPTTPTSVQATQSSTNATMTPVKPSKPASRAALPIVPAVPMVSTKGTKAQPAAEKALGDGTSEQDKPGQSDNQTASSSAREVSASGDGVKSESDATAAPAQTGPKLWTGLFAKTLSTTSAAPTAASQPVPNGTPAPEEAQSGNGASGGFAKSNSNVMAEALQSYRVSDTGKVAFIEPRGLKNTGNMCYMNSVLQVLVFCVPFFDFLDQATKTAHSFKSETPLIDAMIMFMHEYKVIDSAPNVGLLRRRLKNEELEQYGAPFTPEFVYEAINKIPRFANMKRGHQQDAEEFLVLLLECLHEECAKVMRSTIGSNISTTSNSSGAATNASASPEVSESAGGWLEVGPRQRAAVTRSSGQPSTSSPINRIFGGQIRSELRVPGNKDSVTIQTYQSLQLDIGSSEVRNIVDALRGLTKPETIHGDFGSPRGKDVPASKFTYIESLPPVLILHLKRFDFDNDGFGTVKIWKKVGYPLELEIPREVFSRQRRNAVIAEGGSLPRYRLTAVVYHHGKHASGGHYTVDVLRQDGREWIRLDDTVIRRVRSEDVAEGGSEEDSSKPIDANKKESTVVGGGSTNRFAGMGDESTGDNEEGWKQVSTSASGGKKWSSVVNGSTTPTASKPPQVKESVRENKVAYLLFYQRV